MNEQRLEYLKHDIENSLGQLQYDIKEALESLSRGMFLNIYGTIGMNVLYLIKCETEYNMLKTMLQFRKDR